MSCIRGNYQLLWPLLIHHRHFPPPENNPQYLHNSSKQEYYSQNYGSTTSNWQHANVGGGGLGGAVAPALPLHPDWVDWQLVPVLGNIIGNRNTTNNHLQSNSNNWLGGEGGGGDGYDIVGDTGESRRQC